MIQKILIFEFITGGGFSQEELPRSLANEGLLMLKALVRELSSLPGIQLIIVLDWRIKGLALPENSRVIRVSANQHIYDLLPKLIKDSSLVWPIAPEMDGVLQHVTHLIEKQSKRLLNSSSEAIAICGDKLATAQCLNQQGILTAGGERLDAFANEYAAPWVIKPKDGVGCLNSYLVSDHKELIHILSQIESKSDYLIQPFLNGDSLSLSCLFREDKAWLLCCNRQLISIDDGKFKLESCRVNVAVENPCFYQSLINQVARIIPGLYGYVGIDIIQPEQGLPIILEINPRLTTSYVKINQAIGFNVAKAVVEMSEMKPVIEKVCNKQITVSIS